MKHKEQWLKICSRGSTSKEMGKVPEIILSEKDLQNFEAIFEKLRIENPRVTQYIVRTLFLKSRDLADRFFAFTSEKLKSEDEEDRWKAAYIVEEYSHWNYHRVNIELLERMAADRFFGVRSVAAVVFFDLSKASSGFIPLDIIYRLALDGDWYVHTPAFATLKSLTPTRPVALDLILKLFESGDGYLEDLALGALEDIGKVNPEVLSEEKLDILLREDSQRSSMLYGKLLEKLKKLPEEKKQQYYPF